MKITIPKHYRQLGPDEIPQKNDWFIYNGNSYPNYKRLTRDLIASASKYPEHKFYRRRHIAVNKMVPKITMKKDGKFTIFTHSAPAPAVQKKNPTGKLVVVEFEYPSSNDFQFKDRVVQVIRMTDTHLNGLEKTNVWTEKGYKPKYQFKSFLRNKIRYGAINLKSYGNDT